MCNFSSKFKQAPIQKHHQIYVPDHFFSRFSFYLISGWISQTFKRADADHNVAWLSDQEHTAATFAYLSFIFHSFFVQALQNGSCRPNLS